MSHVKVDAKRVQQACENFLEYYKTKLNEKLDEIVYKYVGKREYWLFGTKYTYETAKEMLDNGDIWSKYIMLKSFYGSQDAAQARSLLSLAKLGDPVTLTTNDVWIMEYEQSEDIENV